MIQHHPHLRSRIIISTWESYHPHLRSRMEAVDSSCIFYRCYILMLSSPGKIKKGGNSISLSEIKWYRISLKRFGGQHRHIVSDLLIEVCTLEIFLFWRGRPSTCDGLGGWASWLNYTKFVFDCQLTCSFKCFISPNCCTTDLPKHQVPVSSQIVLVMALSYVRHGNTGWIESFTDLGADAIPLAKLAWTTLNFVDRSTNKIIHHKLCDLWVLVAMFHHGKAVSFFTGLCCHASMAWQT